MFPKNINNHYLKIYGKKGTIEVNLDKIILYKSRSNKSKSTLIKYKKNKDYKKELLNSFINCIKNNKKNYNPNLQDVFSSIATCFAIDKSIKSKKWEKIKLDIWRGKEGVEKISTLESYDDKFYLVKEEVTHYGDKKLILKSKSDGKIIEKIIKD